MFYLNRFRKCVPFLYNDVHNMPGGMSHMCQFAVIKCMVTTLFYMVAPDVHPLL